MGRVRVFTGVLACTSLHSGIGKRADRGEVLASASALTTADISEGDRPWLTSSIAGICPGVALLQVYPPRWRLACYPWRLSVPRATATFCNSAAIGIDCTEPNSGQYMLVVWPKTLAARIRQNRRS